MTKILLETLHQKVNLTTAFCTCLSEGAIFCLDSQKHQTSVPLHVITEDSEITPLLLWETKVDDRMHKTYKDENRTTDWGAMCISMLLALNLTEYTEFETSMKNDGVDFWLSKEGELEFSARLEISGIRSESATNTIDVFPK